MASYCQYVAGLKPGQDDLNKIYHDKAYGQKIEDDRELFARLVLEINQAGLSWTTILRKEENFRQAFAGFEIEKVANFGENDVQNLLKNEGIVRNRKKIEAAIYNAQEIRKIQQQVGSFNAWLDGNHGLDLQGWIKLFKSRFKFVGGEIVKEFLLSSGYLPGAHDLDCPIYTKILV